MALYSKQALVIIVSLRCTFRSKASNDVNLDVALYSKQALVIIISCTFHLKPAMMLT